MRCVVEANQARRKPKVPKGARDFMPEQMAIREKAFAIITGEVRAPHVLYPSGNTSTNPF